MYCKNSFLLPILTASYRILPILTAFYRNLRFLTDSYRFLPIQGYFFVLWAKKERQKSGKGALVRGRQGENEKDRAGARSFVILYYGERELPQLGTEFGSQIHGAAGLYAKGLEELGDMRQGGVDTVLGKAVDLAGGELQFHLLTDVAGPNTGVC